MQVKRCPSLDQLHWSKSELIKKYQPFVSKCFHEIMLNYVVLSLTNARSLAMAIPILSPEMYKFLHFSVKKQYIYQPTDFLVML